MSIDISMETLLSLADAAKTLPGRPHISTLHRWRLRGIRNIKLETVLIGGRRCTSHEALARFVGRTTAAASGEALPTRTPAHRERDLRRAEADMGIANNPPEAPVGSPSQARISRA